MRRWLFLALVLAGAALLPVSVTHAQQPLPVSGTFQVLGPPEVLSSQTVGGVTFITQRSQIRVTGTFTGTIVGEERVIILPTGQAISRADATFTGTVAGRSGTIRFLSVSTVDGTTARGQAVIISGTGGLANLRGQVSIEGSAQTGTGTYTGVLQFVP